MNGHRVIMIYRCYDDEENHHQFYVPAIKGLMELFDGRSVYDVASVGTTTPASNSNVALEVV